MEPPGQCWPRPGEAAWTVGSQGSAPPHQSEPHFTAGESLRRICDTLRICPPWRSQKRNPEAELQRPSVSSPVALRDFPISSSQLGQTDRQEAEPSWIPCLAAGLRREGSVLKWRETGSLSSGSFSQSRQKLEDFTTTTKQPPSLSLQLSFGNESNRHMVKTTKQKPSICADNMKWSKLAVSGSYLYTLYIYFWKYMYHTITLK
jgi:hypothetical protein